MELITPLNWSGKEPVLTQAIGSTHYLVSTVGTRYQPVQADTNAQQWVSHLLVTNVENPRSPSTSVTIRGTDTTKVTNGNTHHLSKINFGYVASWTDTLAGGGIHGNTFAVAYVDSVLVVNNILHPENDIHARFLIFDLTAALADAATESTSDITLEDPTQRTVTINGNDFMM